MKVCRLASFVALETWKANTERIVLPEKAYWMRKAVPEFKEDVGRSLDDDSRVLQL